MFVGDEGAFVGRADKPVLPDSGGEARVHAGDGACAVIFGGALDLHGVENGLDQLADTAEFPSSGILTYGVSI